MPRYYFNLKQGLKLIRDPEGTELPDEASARAHAVAVARELMHNNTKRSLTWRLDVCGAGQVPLFQLLFASIESFRPAPEFSANALPD
jgi:hypothetical protein